MVVWFLCRLNESFIMKRKELNGKNVMENEDQNLNQPYESEDKSSIGEKVKSDRNMSSSNDSESDRAAKNEDEGIRGGQSSV